MTEKYAKVNYQRDIHVCGESQKCLKLGSLRLLQVASGACS